jgi:hypothetical protein
MDAGQTYRYAERTLRAIRVQRMSAAGWRRFESTVQGLRLALDTGDLDEVVAVTEALAALTVPRRKAAADPYRTMEPRSLRPATDALLACLSALSDQHQPAAD